MCSCMYVCMWMMCMCGKRFVRVGGTRSAASAERFTMFGGVVVRSRCVPLGESSALVSQHVILQPLQAPPWLVAVYFFILYIFLDWCTIMPCLFSVFLLLFHVYSTDSRSISDISEMQFFVTRAVALFYCFIRIIYEMSYISGAPFYFCHISCLTFCIPP